MAQDDAAALARIEAFTRQNWAALAALAWRSYKEQGRGGLLIEWRVVEAWEAGEPLTLTPRYVTYTEVPRFQRLIQSYDPEASLVVAVAAASQAEDDTEEAPAEPGAPAVKIIRADARFRAWSFEGQPPPPLAWSRGAH